MKRGDDVTIYMPMIPELPAAMVRPCACHNTMVMMELWKKSQYSRVSGKAQLTLQLRHAAGVRASLRGAVGGVCGVYRGVAEQANV